MRIHDQAASIVAPAAVSGKFSLSATLRSGGVMALAVNGKQVAEGNAGGLIPKQPQDALSIGEDAQTAVGNYDAPNVLRGKVTNVKIATGTPL